MEYPWKIFGILDFNFAIIKLEMERIFLTLRYLFPRFWILLKIVEFFIHAVNMRNMDFSIFFLQEKMIDDYIGVFWVAR